MTTVNSITLNANTYKGKSLLNSVDLAFVPWENNSMVNAFLSSWNVKSITNINNNVIDMSNCFQSTSSLKDVVLPENVLNLSGAFYSSGIVNAPVIPNSVTNMSETFSKCYYLVNAPVIPNSVVELNHTFYYCNHLINPPILSNSIIK